MNRYKKPRLGSRIGYLFLISLLVTLIIYILRGIQVLTFLSGGILLFLVLLTTILGLIYFFEITKRF